MESPALHLRFSTQAWMRADLLKALHAALLTELPRKEVLEFWSRHPFTLFRGPLPQKNFLRYLWEGRAKLPVPYFWSVLADLEAFLEGKSVRVDRLFQLINHGPGGGPPLDPDWVMRAMPSPISGTPPTDPHAWLLAGLPELMRSLLPGCRMDGVEDGSSQSGSRLFLFQPLAIVPESPAPDFRLFPGKLLLGLPKLFGCAAFNRLELLADMRGPAAYLVGPPEDDWNWKGDDLLYRQRRMGRLETLDRAIDAWPEAPALREPLNELLWHPVLRMQKDFAPRNAKEPRLRANRIYGSPVNILRIGYGGNRGWERLAAWLKQKPLPAREALPGWEVADRLHRELIDGLE
ncbi:MAG: hypothetical protein JF616_16325 [Fibrobacteres bacterium]|jgi:hypothetical protein|nr:hypothetical protein [Fibrobacterota bacterium]